MSEPAEPDSHEWHCPECSQVGNYEDLRRPLDFGVDVCPACGNEVECSDE